MSFKEPLFRTHLEVITIPSHKATKVTEIFYIFVFLKFFVFSV
jgi:hypothetical protein